MNYLAHLYFAEPTSASLMANLMGDFVKGVIGEEWHPDLREGVILHRQIDAFTDAHPVVSNSAARLSARRRRFAGIILDISYDHFLSRHWHRFHPQPKAEFIQQSYALLSRYQGYVPESMHQPVRLMIEQDWLSAYANRSQIAMVLDRVARRLSRPERMLGAGEEFHHHYDRLEQDFLDFFPALIAFVAERKKQLGRI